MAKGILKSIGDLVCSLFGLDKAKSSLDENGVLDAANDLSQELSGRHIFETKKDKEAAEKRAKEQERRNIAETAKNTRDIADALRRLTGGRS